MKDSDYKELIGKIDGIKDDVGYINITLARQAVQIEEHVKRTNLAEDNIEMLRQESTASFARLDQEIRPIQRHINMIDGGLKLVGVVSVISGLVISLYKLYLLITSITH